MSRPESKDREWFEVSFAQLVSDTDVRRAARLELARLAAGSDLNPQQADIEGARNYFKKCVFNMSTAELQALSADEAGALWARGALGAARFRRDGGKRKRRLRRSRRLGRRPPNADDVDDRGEG